MKPILSILILLTCLPAFGQRFVKSFATVAEMLASRPIDVHTNCNVIGRNSSSDSGGGGFYYSSTSVATTNLGTVFKPNSYSGRWIRAWDGSNAKVEWFGGFPDDGLDDSAAITAAAEAVYGLKRGTVLLGPGYYNLSSTVYIKHRVKIRGQGGWNYTELSSTDPASDTYLLGGVTHIRCLNGMNADMFVCNSTDGYLRQPSETIEDGSTGDARFQETTFEKIVFNGNNFNNTRGSGIVARQKWNIVIKECGFIAIADRPFVFWDVNGGIIDTVWMKGSIGNQRSRGAIIYSSADCIFNNITAFGFSGPAIWVNGSSSAVNHFSNLLLGNSVVANTSYTVSSVSSGQWTLSSSTWLETGDEVELRTTGTLPTGAGWSDTTLYFAYKISPGVFGLHTQRNLATNGVYLNTTSSGTGTHSFTIGPASALYVSGLASGNSFLNVRADQCSGPGVTVREARYNTFLGGMMSQNTGTNNAEVVDISEQVGFRFDKGAIGNSVIGMSMRYMPYGFQTRFSAQNNLMNGLYGDIWVSNKVHTGTNPSNREFVEVNQLGEIVVGYDTTQTALALKGNDAGVRVLTLDRPSLPGKVGLGVAVDGFNFWNETRGLSIAQLWANTTETRLQLGTSSATPRQSEIVAEGATGTDVSGANLLLRGGSGTGSAAVNGGIFMATTDAGSSGSSSQGYGIRFAVAKEGQISLRKGFISDPVNSPQVGDIWYRSDIDRFRIRKTTGVDNIATETSAALTNVGIGGTLFFTNTAPQLNAEALNGTSGLRINVLGGSTSSGIIRFQTNGTTSQAFFGDGSMTLYGSAAEPVNYEDGKIWYRTDLDHFRGRANGVVYQFITALTGSATWDIASLVTLGSGSTTIAVTGAVAGDQVIVSPSMPAAGVVVEGDVTGSDTVTIRAHNVSGSTIDPASTTFRVKVIKQ